MEAVQAQDQTRDDKGWPGEPPPPQPLYPPFDLQIFCHVFLSLFSPKLPGGYPVARGGSGGPRTTSKNYGKTGKKKDFMVFPWFFLVFSDFPGGFVDFRLDFPGFVPAWGRCRVRPPYQRCTMSSTCSPLHLCSFTVYISHVYFFKPSM